MPERERLVSDRPEVFLAKEVFQKEGNPSTEERGVRLPQSDHKWAARGLFNGTGKESVINGADGTPP